MWRRLFGGEGLAAPPAPPVDQSQTGDAGHQVQFAGEGDALGDRSQPNAVAAQVDVVLVEDLGDRVVPVDVEDHRVVTDILGVYELATTQPRPRRAGLDDEDPTIGQVPGSVLETAHLVVLGQQVVDRVEDQVDEPVATTWRFRACCRIACRAWLTVRATVIMGCGEVVSAG